MDIPYIIEKEFGIIGAHFIRGTDGEYNNLGYKGFIQPIEENGAIMVTYGFPRVFFQGPFAAQCYLEIVTAALYSNPLDGIALADAIKEFNNSNNRHLNNQIQFFIDSQRILCLGFKTKIDYRYGEESKMYEKVQQYTREYVQALINRKDIKSVFTTAATESVMMSFLR